MALFPVIFAMFIQKMTSKTVMVGDLLSNFVFLRRLRSIL